MSLLVYVVTIYKSKYWKRFEQHAIIADEATDSSNTEQISMVVWFVDNNDVIREEFL